jgi:hypothetical protein
MNSEAAKAASRVAFEEIFGLSFEAAAANIDHEWARRMRYSSKVSAEQLATLLCNRSTSEGARG